MRASRPGRLFVRVPLGGERPEDRVRQPARARARERERQQLAQPHVAGMVLEAVGEGVVRGERIAALQEPLAGLSVEVRWMKWD